MHRPGTQGIDRNPSGRQIEAASRQLAGHTAAPDDSRFGDVQNYSVSRSHTGEATSGCSVSTLTPVSVRRIPGVRRC